MNISSESSSSSSSCPPRANGRKRVDMRKIQKKEYLYTTFSKRRTGLFKKAELFCHQAGDMNAAVVVLSPSGKPYAWGNPSAESVIDRFFLMLNQNKRRKRVSYNDHDGGNEISPSNNVYYHQEIQNEEGGGEEEEEEEEGLLRFLQKEVDQGLDVDEIKQYKDSLLVLKKNVEERLDEMRMRRENLIDFFALERLQDQFS